jgi:hypothetical protein
MKIDKRAAWIAMTLSMDGMIPRLVNVPNPPSSEGKLFKYLYGIINDKLNAPIPDVVDGYMEWAERQLR